MCGIVGFVGNDGNEQLLRRMAERVRHRGPDDDGFFIHTPTSSTAHVHRWETDLRLRGAPKGGGVFLGMRRLSIIDCSGGKQPIFNEDGTVGVVHNGEIYNYKALRLELEKAGHVFKTHSDTESIVHGYEEWGIDVFSHLNGMFAIALWDGRHHRLVLGRDRVGEKPLMYFLWNGTLYFGSELKVFFEIPGFPRELNKQSFARFIDQGYVWGNDTVAQNVKRLGAGEYLTYEGGSVRIGAYWSIPTFHVSEQTGKWTSEQDAVRELDSLLSEAVRIRLMSEVPLGVFLSGGLDSSLIAYYAQNHSSQNIKTFSIKFSDESFDESGYARKVAEVLGTEHTELEVGDQELLSIIDELPMIMDEPLADSSVIPMYWLSKLTREHVTVALGGDGGDELFWGYQTFHAWRAWSMVRRLPGFLRLIGAKAVSLLPSSDAYFSLDFKLKRGLFNFDADPIKQCFRWFSPFTTQEVSKLLVGATADVVYNCELNMPACIRGDVLEQSAYLYQTYYLTDDIFIKVDRASMSNSLETRAPFVDYRLIEFANSLPAKVKFRRGKTKYILKRLGERVLPREIAHREKHGFPSPIDRWMRGPLKERVSGCFHETVIKEQGLLNPEYVLFLWQDFLNGNHYRARQIWTLFVWQMWYNGFIQKSNAVSLT